MSGRQKKCRATQILNPKTGRCVKRTGRIGKKLVEKEELREMQRPRRNIIEEIEDILGLGAKSRKSKSRSKKKSVRKSKSRRRKKSVHKSKSRSKNRKCKSDEILNPKTGRCVKRTGAVGKRLLAEKGYSPKQLEFLAKNNLSVKDADENGNILCKNCENCYYCIDCEDCKNCKNCTASEDLIDCQHCYWCNWAGADLKGEMKNCRYCTSCSNCENCEHCTRCERCKNCTDCKNCKNCTDCTDCKNCQKCVKCISCIGLVAQHNMKGVEM